jgi:hypothetical protein
MKRTARTLVLIVGLVSALELAAFGRSSAPDTQSFTNPTGEVRTFSRKGAINLRNPFFQSLGTNGRSCDTCHQASDAWTITPGHVQARFDLDGGLDPIFRTNDGSNSPLADVSTVEARREAFSMLLSKGLIRVGIGMPEGAEFELVGVDDPYGYASASELSLFRRPLPSTNLSFLSAVMWDGRETFAGKSIHFDLSDQANGATLGHAAAANPLTEAQREEIVDFETSLFTAQSSDFEAGNLQTQGAKGGPIHLSGQEFFMGINDTLSPGFNPQSMTLFDRWSDLRGSQREPFNSARASVARGQELFNTFPIQISGVRGLNDVLGQEVITGTCTTCHDAPNVGNHSVSLPLDIGIASESRRTPDMPLYTFRNKTTGEVVKTTDPGRALITGKWKHMSLFKGPILRGLAARPPYFHNGSAATLSDVVNFYNDRFQLNLSDEQKRDLAAFLRAL